MSRDNDMPFGRGETWYNGRTIDTNNLDGYNVQGRVVMFESFVWSDRGVKSKRLHESQVICRVVRNNSGFALLPKRLVILDPVNPNLAIGLAVTTAVECYPVDEFLPSTGVPNGDLFYIVIAGPAMLLTPMAGAPFGTTSIATGDVLVGLTTSGGTTQSGTTANGGRVAGFNILASTTVAQFTDLFNAAVNWIGRAMSAVTSGQTNTDILVSVGRGKHNHH
jgi:hypothetical protein